MFACSTNFVLGEAFFLRERERERERSVHAVIRAYQCLETFVSHSNIKLGGAFYGFISGCILPPFFIRKFFLSSGTSAVKLSGWYIGWQPADLWQDSDSFTLLCFLHASAADSCISAER